MIGKRLLTMEMCSSISVLLKANLKKSLIDLRLLKPMQKRLGKKDFLMLLATTLQMTTTTLGQELNADSLSTSRPIEPLDLQAEAR